MFGWFKRFAWDENKRQINIQNHGIDFKIAKLIFKDKNRIERLDNRKDYGERRLQVIGAIKNKIVFVVYTERGIIYRIISARFASRKERKTYERSN